ncbi:NAD(P)/FAD-dependent oxidoreductase [Aeromicrobium marinum]|nr:NAD(P)/FAD-dependent oxidoreductase [Aeromicrobium marinum]
MHDVLVIGAGPAGLQAALTIGRVHRTALVVDSGEYRNAATAHLHNLIAHDGWDPERLRAAARADLERYDTVSVLRGRVTSVAGSSGDFVAELADGSTRRARRIVLATGVRDELPDVPGLAQMWGRQVAHCPFCDGHELSGRRVGVLGASAPHLGHVAALLAPIAADCVLLAGDLEFDEQVLAQASADGARVRGGLVERVAPRGDGLTVHLVDGETLELDGLFVAPAVVQSAPFAEQLGVELNPSGGVAIDATGRTSVAGVYAAGDSAHHRELPMPMASVAGAIGSGMVAGAASVGDLVMQRDPVPSAA